MAITLVGLVTLGLVLKFLETEPTPRAERRRSADVEPAVTSVAALPAFFVKPGEPTVVVGFADDLVALLENHVRAERAMATKFVHYPSVDSLYRQAQPLPRMN
jgi:hypothetical protein